MEVSKAISMEQAQISPAPEIANLKTNTKICKSLPGFCIRSQMTKGVFGRVV